MKTDNYDQIKNDQKYETYLEKFSRYINIDYPYIYILICFLLFSIIMIFSFITIFNPKNKLDKNLFYNELIWMFPSIITPIFALPFLRKIRKDTINIFFSINNFLGKNVSNSVDVFFKSKLQLIIFPFLLIPFIFQTYSLIIKPVSWWEARYYVEPKVTLITSMFGIINTCIYDFIILYYLFVCASCSYIIFKIGKLLYDLDVKKIELIEWKSLGNTAFLISISWIITLTPSLMMIIVAPIAWWTIGQILIFIISSIIFFIFPIYSTYNTLNHLKNQASLNYKKKIYKYSHFNLNDTNNIKLTNSKLFVQLKKYDLLEKRIANISSWPMDSSQLIQFFSGLLGIVISFILKFYFKINI